MRHARSPILSKRRRTGHERPAVYVQVGNPQRLSFAGNAGLEAGQVVEGPVSETGWAAFAMTIRGLLAAS
jgi:hypothetical protein